MKAWLRFKGREVIANEVLQADGDVPLGEGFEGRVAVITKDLVIGHEAAAGSPFGARRRLPCQGAAQRRIGQTLHVQLDVFALAFKVGSLRDEHVFHVAAAGRRAAGAARLAAR